MERRGRNIEGRKEKNKGGGVKWEKGKRRKRKKRKRKGYRKRGKNEEGRDEKRWRK